MDDIRTAYLATAASTAELIHHPAVAARWAEPSALAYYDVAGLVGHLAGQVLFIGKALAEPRSELPPIRLPEYYRRTAWMTAGHDDEAHVRIREGSAALAAGGPAALAERVDAAVATLRTVLPDVPRERTVRLPSWQWTLSLDDFVLTRLMELVVHADDVAVSVGIATPRLPEAATRPVLDLLVGLAARRHGPTALLRALTRAERAPVSVAAF